MNTSDFSDFPTMETATATVAAAEMDVLASLMNRIQEVIFYLVGTVALTGNLLVVIVIFQYTKMRRNLTNVFIINQSIIDGLSGLVLILSKAFEFKFDRLLSGISGELYCRLWVVRIPLWGLMTSSTWNMVALTLERYMAVVHPIKHRTSFNEVGVGLSVAAVWLSGFVIQIVYKVPTSALSADGKCLIVKFWPFDGAKRLMGIFLVILDYFIPIVFFAFCYLKMYAVMKNKVFPEAAAVNESKETVENKRNHKARKNILKTLMIVIACLIICWSFNQIYHLLTNLGMYPLSYTNPFNTVGISLVYLNCCINPFIYIIHYKQFKQGLRLLKDKLLKNTRFASGPSGLSNITGSGTTNSTTA